MLLALFLAAQPSAWIPAHWTSSDPGSLNLLKDTPVNCLVLESAQWSSAFAESASARGVITLGVVRPGPSALDQARQAAAQKLTGIFLEGDFPDSVVKALDDSKIPHVSLASRSKMRLDGGASIVGTDQGVWPGVRSEENGESKSGPSGTPWIDTNTGFLRFVRALTNAPIWIGNVPPPKTVFPVGRYLQAIGDAAMSGARWVVALDDDFSHRLLAGDRKALHDWRTIGQCLQFYEDHADWRTWQPRSDLALVEDASSGALLSGGILDMIAVKHTPVRPIPTSRLTAGSMQGFRMAADVDPSSLTTEQRAALIAFTHAGGTLLSAPAGWKFVLPEDGQITLDAKSLQQLDDIWKELNSLTGRQNLGARLFNVSTMLSNLIQAPGGTPVVLHLVNYSDFPVDSITVHVAGKFKRARLLMPGQDPQDLQPYEVEEGTGVDIDKMASVAAVELE